MFPFFKNISVKQFTLKSITNLVLCNFGKKTTVKQLIFLNLGLEQNNILLNSDIRFVSFDSYSAVMDGSWNSLHIRNLDWENG